MKIERLAIAEVLLITPRRFDDQRGAFAELYNHDVLAEHLGLARPFVQDNWSLSRQAGTVRALHFQRRPFAQGKLVRVARGAIRDVAVDVRAGSPTYGEHVMVTLTAESLTMLWVPAGFAHGFVTQKDDTEVTYKVTHRYDPGSEVGLQWDDPALGIDWGVTAETAVLSERDRAQTPFAEITPY